MTKMTQPAAQGVTSGAMVLAYVGISSSMLIVNKAAVHALPYPYFVTNLQMIASVVVLYGLKLAGVLKFPNPNLAKLKSWAGVTTVWLLPILCNMRALQLLNVETVMVFRTMTVLGVASGDVFLLKNSMNLVPFVGLLTITMGGILYGAYDISYNREGYIWASMYWFTMVANSLYIKMVFNVSSDMSTWEKSFLNNLLTVPVLGLWSAHSEGLQPCIAAFQALSTKGMMLVLLSCVMGLGISVAGTRCREVFSATGFDVLGNMNKINSIVMSRYLLGSMISTQSLCGLLVALFGGVTYSPLGQKFVSMLNRVVPCSPGLDPENGGMKNLD